MKQGSKTFDSKNFRFGGFWRRVVAGITDCACIILAHGLLFGYENMSTFSEATSSKNTNVPTLLLMYVLYFTVMECSRLQSTFGKLAVGLKVTDRNGDRISFLRSFGRNFSKLASFVMLYAGFLMIAVNKKKLGLHDVFCGTLVVSRGWLKRRNASGKTERRNSEEAEQGKSDESKHKGYDETKREESADSKPKESDKTQNGESDSSKRTGPDESNQTGSDESKGKESADSKQQESEKTKRDEFDAREWKKFEGMSIRELMDQWLDFDLVDEVRASLRRYLIQQDLNLRHEYSKNRSERQYEYRGSDKMTTKDAYDILDLQPGATRDQIKKSHRELIGKFHPDLGGTNLLAAYINNAKAFLLQL